MGSLSMFLNIALWTVCDSQRPAAGAMAHMIGSASGPEILITAIPDSPGGVLRATTVSPFMTFLLA
jgi:hypothetical protein